MSVNKGVPGAQEGKKSFRRFKVCDDQVVLESSENEKIPTTTQNPTQQYFRASPYSSYRSDPLAADKPGEELLPEATVWTIYKKEATEHDNELVKGRNENLDTMLLFAALFSAILTAFLIESTNLLQEDPAETSAALLLLLVQSSLGATNISSELPGSSSFTPEASARWVNGLWFAALSLSLAATLIAMLAKEWLDAFTASHKRAPYAYSISRQARLDGFEAWGAPHIMDLLPTLLHLSLLLFALGLVVYLWRLDQAIAIVLSVIIGLTAVLYTGTVVCGAVYELCPFRTRLSRYLQLIIQFIPRVGVKGRDGHQSKKNSSPDGELTVGDIRALAWLAGHARDQESGDSAYQALAGLSKRKAKRLIPECKTKREHRKLLAKARDVAHFLRDYVTRFQSRLTESPQELAKCRGENIIRYIEALPGIVDCVDTFLGDFDPELDRQECNRASTQPEHPADRVMDLILQAVNEIWSGRYELSASTHAYIAASEFRYTQAIIENEMRPKSSKSLSASQRPATGNGSQSIHIKKRRDISAAELWTRYYATIACATYLIDLHLKPNSRVCSMKPHALLALLEGIATTTTLMLKPPSPYSRPSDNDNITYTTCVDLHEYDMEGRSLSTEFTLIHLLDKLLALSSGRGLTSDVQDASARAMYAVLVLNAEDQARSVRLRFRGLRSHKGQGAAAKAMIYLAFSLASSKPPSPLLGKTLSSLFDVIKNMDPTSSEEIPEILHHELMSMMGSAKAPMSSWSTDARDALTKVLAFELPNHIDPPHKTKTVFASVFNPRTPLDYSWLLSTIQQTPNRLSEVKTLLSELVELFDEFERPVYVLPFHSRTALDKPCLAFFTKSPGFHALAEVGRHADYIPPVAQTIISLCTSSHFQEVKAENFGQFLMAKFARTGFGDTFGSDMGQELFEEYKASPAGLRPAIISPIALPGFLDALTLALDCIQSKQLEELTNVSGFVECAMKLLNVCLMVASHGTFDDDCRLKTEEVARRLCEHGAPRLEIEVVGIIAQYCELPTQTDDEIEVLKDRRIVA